MGEILEIASFLATPLGAILGLPHRRALFFGRWFSPIKA